MTDSWGGPYPIRNPIDPYALWYLYPYPGADRRGSDPWVHYILRLPPEGPAAAKLREVFDLPPGELAEGGIGVRLAPLSLTEETDLIETSAAGEVSGDATAHVGFFPPGASATNDCADPEDEDSPLPPEDSVITAIIDDGIAFAHERFRKGPLSTRIEYFWDQSNRHDVPGRAVPMQRCKAPFAVVPYGRELNKCQIDDLLARHIQAGVTDEAAIYAETRIVDFRRDEEKPGAQSGAHGTHILDLAAGFDMDEAETQDAMRRNPILAVQMPPEAVAQTNGLQIEGYLVGALCWIARRARRLNARLSAEAGRDVRLPVVLNFSFGNYADRHDGLSHVERILDAMLRSGGANRAPFDAITLPAGNSFLMRTHCVLSGASLRADRPAEERTLTLRVLPDNREASLAQFWLPAPASKDAAGPVAPWPNRLQMRLIPPGGPASDLVAVDRDSFTEWTRNGQVMARIYYQLDDPGLSAPPGAHARMRLTVAIQPTGRDDDSQPLAPSGRWRIELRSNPDNPLGHDDTVQAWIERGDTPVGYRRRGRQSSFEDEAYDRFIREAGVEAAPTDDGPVWRRRIGDLEERDSEDTPIRRRGTLSAIATGEKTMAVAGHRKSDLQVAFYSSSGSPAPGEVPGPGLSAICEDSRLRPDRIAAGTYSGSTARFRGTSVSAPLVARQAVEILQANPAADVRDALQTAAAEDERAHGDPPPEDRWRIGHGRSAMDFARTKPRRVQG